MPRIAKQAYSLNSETVLRIPMWENYRRKFRQIFSNRFDQSKYYGINVAVWGNGGRGLYNSKRQCDSVQYTSEVQILFFTQAAEACAQKAGRQSRELSQTGESPSNAGPGENRASGLEAELYREPRDSLRFVFQRYCRGSFEGSYEILVEIFLETVFRY